MNNVVSMVAASVVSAVLFFAATFKCLGALQQCGYKNKEFTAWLRRKDNLLYNRLALWAGLTFLSVMLVALCFSFAGKEIAQLLTILPFAFFALLYCSADRKFALKVPVKITGRIKRLSAVYILITACVNYIAIALLWFIGRAADNKFYYFFEYLPFTLMPLALPYLLCAANAIDGVYENKRNKKFVIRAGQVLDETKIIRVAIVGSYGKTSVKNILATLLEEKYTVAVTPESYNTPIGIAKTVSDENFKGKEVFVAEMGARHIGDIQYLCELVKPDYAIFTGVCAQHIASFGSIENVTKAKGEVIKSSAKKIVCGGRLKEYVGKYLASDLTDAEKEKCEYLDFEKIISDLRLAADGTSFKLTLPRGGVIEAKTRLLGKHSVGNIALAAFLAQEMGLTAEEIAAGIARLQPTPHRLQLIESGGVHILDDSYNSNPEGAKEAVAALFRFSGRKIVVTPGIVETGILEEQINGELGRELVGIDEVILVGDTLVGAVKSGYLAAGGDETRLLVVKTLDEAQAHLAEILQSGDAVLFLNDLPDIY